MKYAKWQFLLLLSATLMGLYLTDNFPRAEEETLQAALVEIAHPKLNLFESTAQPSRPSLSSPALVDQRLRSRIEITKFDQTLARFKNMQNELTSSHLAKPYISALICDMEACPGLGDYIKATLSTFVLALILDRPFVIGFRSNHELWDYYDSEIDWRTSTANSIAPNADLYRPTVDCWIRPCSCYQAYSEQLHNPSIVVRSGNDCAGYLTRMPEFEARVKELGIIEDGMWRSKIMQFLLRPTEKLLVPIKRILGYPDSSLSSGVVYPSIVSHTRIGGSYIKDGVKLKNPFQPGDRDQDGGQNMSELVRKYGECLQSIMNERKLRPSNVSVFIAADSQDVIDLMVREYKLRGVNTLTGEKAGPLGHIRLVSGTYVRTYVEFEFMRHAQYLVAGESGLSLIAHKVRTRSNAYIYAGWRDCTWAWTTYHTPLD